MVDANQIKEITKDFDYSKLTEETTSMLEWSEQMTSEIEKMKVECAIANIDLASTIDAIDFESKIKNVEEMIQVFVNNCDIKKILEEKDGHPTTSSEKNDK